MDKKEFEEKMLNLKKEIEKDNAIIEDLHKIGFSIESPVIERIFYYHERLMEILAAEVGDRATWIEWFIFENDWGKREYEVVIDKKEKKIKTFADLYKVIVTK